MEGIYVLLSSGKGHTDCPLYMRFDSIYWSFLCDKSVRVVSELITEELAVARTE